MYNAVQKERYLNQIGESEGTKYNKTLDIFKRIEDVEEMFDKDICNFTTPEILDTYRIMCTTSLYFLHHTNAYLSYYAQWCLQESLINDSQNHFDEITTETLKHCINRTGIAAAVLTRKEIEKIADQISNAQDAWVYLGLFEGIGAKGFDFEELTEAKYSDIDTKNNTIKLCTGRTIKISDKLIGIAKDTEETDVYYGKRFNYKLAGNTIYKDMIRKNASYDKHQKAKRINTMFARVRKELGLSTYITTKKIIASGIIEYVNKIASEKDLTVHDIFYKLDLDIFKEITNQYNLLPMNRDMFLKTYGDYLI